MVRYILNVLLTIDQSLHVIFLFGDPDVSISSHLALAKRLDKLGYAKKKWFVDSFAKFVDFLFHNKLYSIEENHIENSLEIFEDNHKAIWKWYKMRDEYKDHNIRKLL